MATNLTNEIARFKRWARDHEGTCGEWEIYYEHWNDLWAAAKEVMQNYADKVLDIETSNNLLYAIARDNESELLRDELIQYPSLLQHLAQLGVKYPDQEAKWQIAITLAEAKLSDAADLIRPYLTDSNEYVRRRSLLAIAPFSPIEAENIAKTWMEDDYEYSGIAGLHVLNVVDSDSLSFYLERHTNDPNQYVRSNVEEIRKKRSENNKLD